MITKEYSKIDRIDIKKTKTQKDISVEVKAPEELIQGLLAELKQVSALIIKQSREYVASQAELISLNESALKHQMETQHRWIEVIEATNFSSFVASEMAEKKRLTQETLDRLRKELATIEAGPQKAPRENQEENPFQEVLALVEKIQARLQKVIEKNI